MSGQPTQTKTIRSQLLADMKDGPYAACERLPRESVLAEKLGISRTQLRDILASLEREGFITRRHGVGTIINRHVLNVQTRMDIEVEFLDMIRQSGHEPAVAFVRVADGTADAKTPEAMRDELVELGGRYTNTASLRLLGLDSGGSSQCDFDGLGKIYSSRRVAGYLCVWTKESGQEPPEQEERPVSRKTVCLDPGHGPGCVNGAPDGSYQEREFTWDMYRRIAPLLERQGVRALCTRTEDSDPSLTERAGVSNRAGADCYVSLHSNAAGNDGWYDASGLEIYTSAGPETAQRNVLASALADAFRAAGVALRSSPIKHQMYTVLAKTDATACLIENGFHTSKADVEKLKDSSYRDKLAEATARGLCAWLGVAWQEPADDVSELDTAVDKLADAGLINSPDYWKAGDYSAENVQALLIKWAASLV